MSHLMDLSGRRFGRLTVIERASVHNTRRVYWRCRCECDTIATVQADNLRAGRTASCGCVRREVTAARSLTHGATGTTTYSAWATLKNRCCNPRQRAYKNYGGRGITICDAWRDDFAAFHRDMGMCPAGHSIERIDNDGPYAPGNCRWATPTEQANNRRTNVLVTIDGHTRTLAEWAKAYGCNYFTAYNRLRKGWPPHDAFALPAHHRPAPAVAT